MTAPVETSRFEVSTDVKTHFAWVRTRLGLERTFMAWIRTSISLIGFGFTITQFFQHLRDASENAARPIAINAPRDLGLTLIVAGVLGLIAGTVQYRAGLRYLWSEPYKAIAGLEGRQHGSPVFIAALVMMLIGIAAFFAVLFHLT
jgi:putative membrane protein